MPRPDPPTAGTEAAVITGFLDFLRETIALKTDGLDAVERSRADLPLDDLGRLSAAEKRGERFSARWVLVHLVEEYGRHAGHADLLREAIDGTTGE